MGVAGVFAAHRIATKYKSAKVIGFDIGRPPQKRRRRLFGWLGALPSSDGKVFLKDIDKVSEIVGIRKTKVAYNQFSKILSNVGDFKITKDRPPNKMIEKKFIKQGYSISLNDYIQMYPADIHALSKYVSSTIELNKNITFKFDNEVLQVFKNKKHFLLQTEQKEEFQCNKLIIAVGRSGWRWANDLYTKFGIIENNDISRFGIRIEMSSSHLKEFNKSNCSIIGNDVEIGPLSWFGTVIPEDHTDMAISAFRSNEGRWKSDKVSFNLIGSRFFPGKGFEQTDCIGNLTFVLANDRIIKERVSSIMTGRSKISIIPEYNWLKDSITNLGVLIPEILTKGYFHAPTIIPMAPKINLGDNLSSEIDGLFVAGESGGIHGILSAALSGIVVADSACKMIPIIIEKYMPNIKPTNTNASEQSSTNFPILDDTKEGGSSKYGLSKFDYDLFKEEDNTVEKVIRVKRVALPNDGERWKFFVDSKVVLVIEGSKFNKKERNFLRSIDGTLWLLSWAKAGISSFNALKKDLKKKLKLAKA